MNLEYIMFRERSHRHKRLVCYEFLLYEILRLGKSIEMAWFSGAVGKGKLGITAFGYGVSKWDVEKFWS